MNKCNLIIITQIIYCKFICIFQLHPQYTLFISAVPQKRATCWKINDLPECNAVLRIIQALNGSEEIRQGVGRISADESNNDPRSQKRRFRTPALFGKVAENRAGNVQQTQQTQKNREHRRDPPKSPLNTHYLGARNT